MIDPKELRIGNLADTAVGIIQVEEIPIKSNPLYNPKALNPIPLSQEWLEKMGFKRQNNAWEGPHKNDFSIWNPIYSERFELNSDPIMTNIKFVHQLQNIYFALTGTELTIKP